MKVILNQQKEMKRGEIILSFHPKNKELVIYLKDVIEAKIGEVEVKDEYNNHFFIPLINIYYFEVIEQKVFVYTKEDVYRLYIRFHDLKDLLFNKGFIQVNVRTIVNERHIIKYEMLKGCHRRLILDNQEVIISNRQYKEDVDKMLRERSVVLQEKKVSENIL